MASGLVIVALFISALALAPEIETSSEGETAEISAQANKKAVSGDSAASPASAAQKITPEKSATTTSGVATKTSPTPVTVGAVIQDGPTFTVWRDALIGTRVHFVAHVVNEGTVPVEIRNIKYEMRSATGAIVEVGDIPQAYPNKIAPGASAVIGRTVRADAAVANSDVTRVDIRFETVRTSSGDNLLDVSNISLRGSSLGQPVITGDVQNNGRVVYNNIQTAVVLIDPTGKWIGYVTATLPVDRLKPGDKAQFVTSADLPPGLSTRAVSFGGFSFDK